VKMSLGLLEVSGLALAINTADAMAKSAAVTLVGIDTCKGGGWMTIKITGDVAAVNSALNTGAALAEKHGGLIAKSLLARPDEQLMQQVVPTPKIQPEPEAVEPTVSAEENASDAEEITVESKPESSAAEAFETEDAASEDDESESGDGSVFTEGTVNPEQFTKVTATYVRTHCAHARKANHEINVFMPEVTHDGKRTRQKRGMSCTG